MQDRLKFRGVLKLATQKIVVYSSFLKNYDDELVLSITEDYFKEQVYKAGYKLTKEDWKIVNSYSDQDDYYPIFNFYCERVEQCTGLKDKNGKLIYEGDILQDSEQKILVKYDVSRHCFMFEYQDTSAYKRICDMDVLSGNFEVIGNVHENADLLENKR